MSVEDRVKKIVSDQLGKSMDEIQSDSSFVDDLGADSLDTVELVMALEEEFDLEIADEDAEKISTVNEAVEYINSCSWENVSPKIRMIVKYRVILNALL